MSVKVYVPRDSAALSMGADQVADAVVQEAGSRGVDVQLVRNGSRGMLWLEPLVEVETEAEESSGATQRAGETLEVEANAGETQSDNDGGDVQREEDGGSKEE